MPILIARHAIVRRPAVVSLGGCDQTTVQEEMHFGERGIQSPKNYKIGYTRRSLTPSLFPRKYQSGLHSTTRLFDAGGGGVTVTT